MTTFYWPESFEQDMQLFLDTIAKDETILQAAGVDDKSKKRNRRGLASVAIRLLIESYISDKKEEILARGKNATSN